MDQSVVSVLGEPTGGTGPCKTSCQVGGTDAAVGTGNGATSSDGRAQGGRVVEPPSSGAVTRSGTAFNGFVLGTGRYTNLAGSISGNFRDGSGTLKGHCTGFSYC